MKKTLIALALLVGSSAAMAQYNPDSAGDRARQNHPNIEGRSDQNRQDYRTSDGDRRDHMGYRHHRRHQICTWHYGHRRCFWSNR